jgi:IMP dehydrogenase/GMP reductase
VTSGTYTPTTTAITNVTTAAGYTCQYIRVGNVVTVSGALEIDPSGAAVACELEFTLPISSNIAGSINCAGHGGIGDASVVGVIRGNLTTDKAAYRFTSVSGSSEPHFIHFTYRVI